MSEEREGYLEKLSRVASEEDLFDLACTACEDYGFEYFSFGARAPLPLTAPRYHFMSSYPSDWKKKYLSEDYVLIDPTVRYALSAFTPLIWSGEDFSEDRFFWDEAESHGIRHGWTIPVRGKYGLISMFSLARSAQRISALEAQEKEPFLLWITSMLQVPFGDLMAARIVPESSVRLTAREAEMLKWTAVGKTYEEIALILTIEQRTVKFHLVNAMRKLNSSNKAEATMKAYAIGLLN